MTTFNTTYTGNRVPFKKTQKVFVIVRHTRSSDKRVAVTDDDGTPAARANAMDIAEGIAQDAANTYGEGATSVFRGELVVSGHALKGGN